MQDIKVYVVRRTGRKNLTMRYADPVTDNWIERTTGTTSKREAERVAAVWQADLCEGRYKKPSRVTWAEFRDEYYRHVLAHKRDSTVTTYDATFSVFEQLVGPKYVSSINKAVIRKFTTGLRNKRQAAPATICRHLRTLQAVLQWAVESDYLAKLPPFDKPKQPKKRMGGRPITDEEFHILLSVVPESVGERAAPLWQFFAAGILDERPAASRGLQSALGRTRGPYDRLLAEAAHVSHQRCIRESRARSAATNGPGVCSVARNRPPGESLRQSIRASRQIGAGGK